MSSNTKLRKIIRIVEEEAQEADPATTAAQGEAVLVLVVAGRTQNQEEIWGKWQQLMIRMIMINKLIMITVPNNQVLVFIKTITKETKTELTKVLLEVILIVRNFTIKNNEIYPNMH